jgi:hypothetical protein
MTAMKLFSRTSVIVALCVGAVCASTLLAIGRPKSPKPEDVTLVGLVVDLQTYMTEKCPNEDFAKCTRDNIRGGVPAALETDDGLIIVGMGDKGPARLLVPLAYQNAEVTGKLYDRDGLLYLDMTAAKIYKEESEEEPHEQQPQPPEGGGTPPEP